MEGQTVCDREDPRGPTVGTLLVNLYASFVPHAYIVTTSLHALLLTICGAYSNGWVYNPAGRVRTVNVFIGAQAFCN